MQQVTNRQLWGLILIAYIFSFAIRMIWIYQFHADPNVYWNGQMMINTNDGYYFASGAQKVLYGLHMDNPRIPSVWGYGTVALTALLVKITPFSLETVILYLPALISSLVVVPIILLARLYGETIWGFFAALLGAIAWSYYNRTMVGYYDTDMFSAMAPMFILYFLVRSTIDFNLRSALYAALFIAVYPFLYDAGATIIYAMGIIYAGYLIFYHRHSEVTYQSLILVFFALLPLRLGVPYEYMVKIVLLLILYILLQRYTISRQAQYIIVGILLLGFLYVGNVFEMVYHRILQYTDRGVSQTGLHFYSVFQTIREAGQIPFETFANRISGSVIGLIVSLVGYVVLVMRHRAFILALPLVGIGMFALWGGLRFTVYAVPIAAMSAIYLIHTIIEMISDKRSVYWFGMILLSAALITPNIVHIVNYKVPTVMSKAEVEDLDALNKIASSKDYTLTWWDYGYPVWFYSDTNTIIDGGKHQNDNYIVSKILQTTSPVLAANLSRLAVETYVDSNYSNIADTLFRNGKEDQVDPDMFLSQLDDPAYPLPTKSRDIYLYMPYRMLEIFPTVTVFGNIDLKSGDPERRVVFYPGVPVASQKGVIQFNNGIVFDGVRGELLLGKQRVPVKFFAVTQLDKQMHIRVQRQVYHPDSSYVVIFMKSYGKFIVLDEETYHSLYVQMFILGEYDKNYFSLVHASPYSRIYRLKR